jgi:hypothetical protein
MISLPFWQLAAPIIMGSFSCLLLCVTALKTTRIRKHLFHAVEIWCIVLDKFIFLFWLFFVIKRHCAHLLFFLCSMGSLIRIIIKMAFDNHMWWLWLRFDRWIKLFIIRVLRAPWDLNRELIRLAACWLDPSCQRAHFCLAEVFFPP